MRPLGRTNPEDARQAIVTWLEALNFARMAEDAADPKKTSAGELYRYVRVILSDTERNKPALHTEVSRRFRALGF